ncbi:hypothetical protein FPV67DRAFT_1419798, partial [Lyophyllum atratum]
RYCSKACQASHWKVHKEYCNTNAKHAATLAQADRDGSYSRFIPPGITLTELDTRLDKWIKFHIDTLMAATVHALALDRDINRARTHVMNILIHSRTDHHSKRGKYFRIVEAEVVDMSVGKRYTPAWAECVQRFKKLQDESDGDGSGTVAAIVLECPPLSLLLLPFSPLLDARRIVNADWKGTLIKDIEKGTKFDLSGAEDGSWTTKSQAASQASHKPRR